MKKKIREEVKKHIDEFVADVHYLDIIQENKKNLKKYKELLLEDEEKCKKEYARCEFIFTVEEIDYYRNQLNKRARELKKEVKTYLY